MATMTSTISSSSFTFLPSHSIFLRSSASSKKVANHIVRLSTIDFDGKKHEVIGLVGQTHLKALTNKGLIDPTSHHLQDIDTYSIECEVKTAQEWLDKLPPRTYDEGEGEEHNSRVRVLNKQSRLDCQVVLNHHLQGMVIIIPKPKPWDTP